MPLCERGPGAHQRPVIAYLQGVFHQKPLAEWTAWFASLDVCFAPVNTLPEAFDDPQTIARGLIIVDDLDRRHVGPAIRFRDEPARPSLREPGLGQHNDDVLGSRRTTG